MRQASLPRAGIALGALLLASPALAGSWRDGPVHLQTLPRSSHEVIVHPTPTAGAPRSSGFSLFDRGQMTLAEAVQALIREEVTSPLVAVHGAKAAPGFALSPGASSSDYSFFIGSVPICGVQLRAHQLGDGSAFVLGTVPDINSGEPAPQQWPDPEASAAQAAKVIRHLVGPGPKLRGGAQSRCIYASSGKLIPVWQQMLYADTLPYQILADDHQAISIEQKFLDASPTALAYPRSAIQGTRQPLPLAGVDDSGRLRSQYLQTVVPAGYDLATATADTFDFPEGDQRFAEASAFAHASAHLAWFQALGFTWWDEPAPLKIILHALPGGQTNNALFTPGSSSDHLAPNIEIGDGDNISLQNLALDGDVVSHEFGHNVIYRTLQTTSGESLVLHEGLADAFVFFRTGDPCLGRSICPDASATCIVPGQCLRTGVLDLAYGDPTWVSWAGPHHQLGHAHGQLISGLLWDLRKNQLMAAADVASLTMKVVSYFKVNSGLCDFTAALFAADKDLFDGAHAASLTAVLTARGMQQFLPTAVPQCTTMASAASLTQDGTGGAIQSADKLLKCGTIAIRNRELNGLWLMILWLLPLLLIMRPVPARAREKRRQLCHKPTHFSCGPDHEP